MVRWVVGSIPLSSPWCGGSGFPLISVVLYYKSDAIQPYIKSVHFLIRTKEVNVVFNDALNTFFFYGFMASDWVCTGI